VTTGIRNNFPLQVLVVLVIGGGGVAVPWLWNAPFPVQRAAALGAMISTANVLAGYLSIRYAYMRSYTTFIKIVLGGMGVRMALMLGVLAALVFLWDIEAVALMVSALAFYAAYLILEIVYLQNSLSMRNQA
jgi:hypothetical protein